MSFKCSLSTVWSSSRRRILFQHHVARPPIQVISQRSRVRNLSDNASREVESTNVGHSRFLAEASSAAKWHGGSESRGKTGGVDPSEDDFDKISDGKGKLSPTSSHLFKLIIPLGQLSSPSKGNVERKAHSRDSRKTNGISPPTVILLHPSQPLSHVARLILASFAPPSPEITFRSKSSRGETYQWSDSTDVGDFIQDAARSAQFFICLEYPENSQREMTVIEVQVPTFADRTRFLRRRLNVIEKELSDMEGLKKKCHHDAHHGARRMAVGGLGMLVVYWAAVARLTFWDYGWEFMEPLTYLSGLSTVICGYLWFLYQGREVSYSSVLNRSISTRRETLYKAHGLDIDRWLDLMREGKTLRKEIERIAQDYEEGKKLRETERESEREEEKEREEGDEESAGGVREGEEQVEEPDVKEEPVEKEER